MIVDCDVHNGLASPAELKPYLDERWHAQYDQLAGRASGGITIGSRPHPSIFRQDTRPAGGGAPGSSLELLREQLLERFGVGRAVLSPLEILKFVQAGAISHALNGALNDWVVAEWLDKDPRLFGSIAIPIEDAVRAAEEIHRVAPDPRFVQVLVTVGTSDPLGHPRYWPIYEAAVAHDLPVTVHVGGFRGLLSSTGWTSYHVERHVAWTHFYQAHVVSFVTSGVLERFPTLRIVLQEGGIAWMPALMWRLDRARHDMAELTHLSERPSELVRRHFWFTTQPMDEPEKPEYLVQMFEQLGMDDRVMFASDYPHWDFDPPDRVLPRALGADLRERILSTNAEAVYRFPPVPAEVA